MLPFGITKPLVLPGVSKKALAKEKSKNVVCASKEKEKHRFSERDARFFAESMPVAEGYGIPKGTGFPVAGRAMQSLPGVSKFCPLGGLGKPLVYEWF